MVTIDTGISIHIALELPVHKGLKYWLLPSRAGTSKTKVDYWFTVWFLGASQIAEAPAPLLQLRSTRHISAATSHNHIDVQ